ncbi:MAG TPA: 5'/3'-nucleotidase SurE [Candidatus Acidoferrales bacterium]
MKRRSVLRFLILVAGVLLLHGGMAPAQQQPAPFTILLTNDDGYGAPGLNALAAALAPLGEVIVVAPAVDQSGKGHSIVTASYPILASERRQPNGAVWYALDAPPATCARVGLENLLPRRPDVVISGINRGENLGINVYLSGTLGGAREAAILGVPAIAVSARTASPADYEKSGAYIRQLIEQLRAQQMLKPGLFLNVNVPAGEIKGVKVTRLSVTPNHENYERRASPRGRPYFWSRWRPLDDDAEGTDVWAFARGYIAVTPMIVDVTAYKEMESFRGLEQK